MSQGSPRPLAFNTVPAFRAREHRGGEHDLLKDAFPSGFCRLQPEQRPLPTTTATAATVRTRSMAPPPSKLQLRYLLEESKEVGVPPCGAASNRRPLNITRVLVGAKKVVDTVGSDLVQFAGFSIGPAEYYSPRRGLGSPHHPRPSSPISPSRMTIDGSSLLRRGRGLLVEPRAVNQWSRRKKICAQDDLAMSRDARKRIRPTTADRAQSGGGPEPWPYAAEVLTGRSSSRPGTAAQGPMLAPRTRGESPGGAEAIATRLGDDGDKEQAGSGATGCGEEGPAAVAEAARVQADGSPPVDGGDHAAMAHGTAENHGDDPQKSSGDLSCTHQLDSVPLSSGGKGTVDTRNERIEDDLALLHEDELNGSGRLGGAWAKDTPSFWSEDSARLVASVTTNDNPSVGQDSFDRASGKRSFSSLGTERYRESLSKDATNILRSHLGSRNDANSCFSVSHYEAATDATVLVSPVPPPAPSGQVRQHTAVHTIYPIPQRRTVDGQAASLCTIPVYCTSAAGS